jgi:hypothetical protein
MLFRFTTMMDMSGRPYDMTTLKDWLYNSDEKTISIPRSHVASIIEPSQKCKSIYMQQLDNLSAVSSNVVTNEDREMAEKGDSSVLGKLEGDDSEMGTEKMNGQEMIYMSMVFPPEMIMNLITSGILDPRDLQKMIKEVKKKNKFTGDEKDRKDFGNKFSDWNPDPNSDDYA